MGRIGVWSVRHGQPSRWCRECWLGWFEDKFRKTFPQKVVTLSVTIDNESEDCLAITCTGLDGSELLRAARIDISASRVGDIRQKLRYKLDFGEDLRLLPDGWFYSQSELEAWASSFEGGVLPLEPRERTCEPHYGRLFEQPDHKHLDALDRSEAHWESVWATAPKLTQQINLCTPDGRLLANGDDDMLLHILSDSNCGMRPAP